jgi:DNA primase catalytic subunit
MNVSARTGARFQEFFTEMEKQVRATLWRCRMILTAAVAVVVAGHITSNQQPIQGLNSIRPAVSFLSCHQQYSGGRGIHCTVSCMSACQ